MTSIRSLRSARSKSYNSLDNDSSEVSARVSGDDAEPPPGMPARKFKIDSIARKMFRPKSARRENGCQQPSFIPGGLDGKSSTACRKFEGKEANPFLEDNPFNNNVQLKFESRRHSDLETQASMRNGVQSHGNENVQARGMHSDPTEGGSRSVSPGLESSEDFDDDSFNVKKFHKPELRLSLASKLQKRKFVKETRKEKFDRGSCKKQNEINDGKVTAVSYDQTKTSPLKSPRFSNLKLVFDRAGKSKCEPEKPPPFHVSHILDGEDTDVDGRTKNRSISNKVKTALQSLSPSKSQSPLNGLQSSRKDVLANDSFDDNPDFNELFLAMSCRGGIGVDETPYEGSDPRYNSPDSGVNDHSTTVSDELHAWSTERRWRTHEDSGWWSSRHELSRDSFRTTDAQHPFETSAPGSADPLDLPKSIERLPGTLGSSGTKCDTPVDTSGSSTPSFEFAASTPSLSKGETKCFQLPQSISTYGFMESQSGSSKESFETNRGDNPGRALDYSKKTEKYGKKLPKSSLSFSSLNLRELGSDRLRKKDLAGSLMDCSRAEEETGDHRARPGGRAGGRRYLKKKFVSMETRASQLLSRHIPGTSNTMGAGDNVHEEASLLGGEGPEELRHIRLSVSAVRSLVADGSLGDPQQVETEHGPVTITVVGDTTKPTILTYHDLGLNHVTNFQSFFLYPDMRSLLSCFNVVSVNAPGQEEGAPNLPAGYVYPTMDQLAETVERVRAHLSLRSFIGFGVGLGANVLTRYSVTYPQHVDALVLLNCSVGSSGWVEWGYQKLNIRQLRAGTMTTGTVDYLLWHHFGKLEQCSQDVVTVYRQLFESHVNAANLALLIEAYIARTDLGIVREMDPNKKKGARMVRVPVLNVTSNYSPHIDDTVAFNARLDPANSSWMKIQDCGLVLEEQPGKMMEALRLFLQGQGYVVGGAASRRASCVPQSGAVHTRRLGARQNSLPLIGGVPGVKGGSLLPSVVDDEGQEEGTGSPTNEEPKTAANESSAQNGPTNEEPDVSVVGGAGDTDIRITENPLEQPAV